MFRLLLQRSFGAMTLSQFLGAFNDNAFKQLVALLAVSLALPWVADHGLAQEYGQALPTALFSLPFVLFCTFTGSLADRFSKSSIIKIANVLEILVMGGALAAFWFESYSLLLGIVFLMGSQSALFGPSKYGSIGEIVGERQLSRANALIQTTTMIAVIGGIVVGGQLLHHFGDALWIPAVCYIGFATLGWLISLRIEHLPAAAPTRRLDLNPVTDIRRHWRATGGDRTLILAIFASSFFYLVAAALLLVVNEYGVWLGLEAGETSLMNGLVAIGIAVGALCAGKISGEGIEGGLIPIGLGGMALCLMLVQISPETVRFVQVLLLLSGIAAGLCSVPIRALIQARPKPEDRGSILGLSEVLDFCGVFAGSGLLYLMKGVLGLAAPAMFLIVGALIVVFLVVALYFAGEFAVRVMLLVLIHSMYRLRVQGRENLPRTGGGLLVANHLSFIDALLVAAASPRPVRFLMYRAFFDLPFVGWFARRMGAIPVSAEDGRRAKVEAIRAAAAAAKSGELVCIFAEGAITRTGAMLPFARGLERIARDAGVPIVPISLDRLWGSIFSFEGGKVFWKWPQRLPYPVDIRIGTPLPADSPAWVVRNVIQEGIADLRRARGGPRGSLAWRFVRASKTFLTRTAIVDSSGRRLSYWQLLIACIAFRKVLQRELGPGQNVGVLLPPGAGGAITNISLALIGRTSVNLNYTLSNAALAGPLDQAEVGDVLTSRRFLEALGREAPEGRRALYVDELLSGIGRLAKLRAGLLSLLPAGILARIVARGRSSDDIATILFSSGSTGAPKGVMLSCANVLSNSQSALQVLHVGPKDALLGVLPFFHSFGYTVTQWMVLLSGAKAVYHPNPLDAKRIGELCEEESITVLIATPTFYLGYLRRIKPEQLRSARLTICGAEKLRPNLAAAWEKRFGLPLLEGYGATELSPVVSINLPNVEGLGSSERGHKPGSIGRPIPGVAVRVVDPDTRELRAIGEEGLLEVKGPNVMVGYLKRPEATAEVIRDGWYSTGDIALIDKDGFIVITDRLSRFSKIGGEMVPHGRVEEVLLEAARRLCPAEDDAEGPELAVTAVPDERKGEQLVVLHTRLTITVEALLIESKRSDLPALFVPRASNFVEVDELPRLGSGKTDLKGLRTRALDAFPDPAAGAARAESSPGEAPTTGPPHSRR